MSVVRARTLYKKKNPVNSFLIYLVSTVKRMVSLSLSFLMSDLFFNSTLMYHCSRPASPPNMPPATMRVNSSSWKMGRSTCWNSAGLRRFILVVRVSCDVILIDWVRERQGDSVCVCVWERERETGIVSECEGVQCVICQRCCLQ